MKNYLLPFAAIALLFASCSSDDDNTQVDPIVGDYAKGILITNEGPFMNGSGTVTYVSDDFLTIEQKIYKNVNGSDLGNIVQSMGFNNSDAYIVVSNSQKLMVADRYTFEKKDSIVSGFVNPRYFASNGQNQGYVTDWGDPTDNNDDFVALIDLQTNNITSTISVPFGPEKILNHEGSLYVAHPGGYGQNNLISVIAGNSVVKTITVGDVPNSMVVVGNSLYVLGNGKPDYSGEETAGSITKINLSTNEVINTYTFNTTDHPQGLTAEGSQLYYNMNGKVYKLDAGNITLPGAPILDGFFYAMEVKDGKLYATDAKDYASQGSLYVYDLSSNQQIQDIQTGIIPGGIYFNN